MILDEITEEQDRLMNESLHQQEIMYMEIPIEQINHTERVIPYSFVEENQNNSMMIGGKDESRVELSDFSAGDEKHQEVVVDDLDFDIGEVEDFSKT